MCVSAARMWKEKKLGNWKGTGKDRDPILNKRKGKERFPFFCLEDRKGPHSRKNGQVNMYDIWDQGRGSVPEAGSVPSDN